MVLTLQEWIEKYKPIMAGIDCPRLFQRCDEYSKEYVWTLVDTEGTDVIMNGIRFINRAGYYICEVPYTETLLTLVYPNGDEND